MERFFKLNFHGADPEGLSAIDPTVYRERFLYSIIPISLNVYRHGAHSGSLER
jgi:hypothetical protein